LRACTDAGVLALPLQPACPAAAACLLAPPLQPACSATTRLHTAAAAACLLAPPPLTCMQPPLPWAAREGDAGVVPLEREGAPPEREGEGAPPEKERRRTRSRRVREKG
jgi:hypothetical protein